MATIGNGWPVIDVRGAGAAVDKGRIQYSVTVYLRIPRELATPIDGGCSCTYCTAHPDEVPRWDTLAVCDVPGDHSWTVHYPDPRRQTIADRTAREARARATGVLGVTR